MVAVNEPHNRQDNQMKLPTMIDLVMQRAIEHPEDARAAMKAIRSQWHTLTTKQRYYARRIADGTALDKLASMPDPDDTCWQLVAVMDHYQLSPLEVAEATGRSKWTVYTWRNSDIPGKPSPGYLDEVITLGQKSAYRRAVDIKKRY